MLSPAKLTAATVTIARDVQARLNVDRRPDRSEQVLWRELSCCILSSQVQYSLASAAAKRIHDRRILTGSKETTYKRIEQRLFNALASPLDVVGSSQRYRFPRVRATQLARCWMRLNSQTLTASLSEHTDPCSLRHWLVSEMCGLGPKQASMFMRNVGITYDMAVIDRHVIKYMASIGMIPSPSISITSLRSYERFETELSRHAVEHGFSVGVFDWAIWIVMRAATQLDLL